MGDSLNALLLALADGVHDNTKTLIGDGPITVTETPEGIKIGSTATGGGSVTLDTTITLEDVM